MHSYRIIYTCLRRVMNSNFYLTNTNNVSIKMWRMYLCSCCSWSIRSSYIQSGEIFATVVFIIIVVLSRTIRQPNVLLFGCCLVFLFFSHLVISYPCICSSLPTSFFYRVCTELFFVFPLLLSLFLVPWFVFLQIKIDIKTTLKNFELCIKHT